MQKTPKTAKFQQFCKNDLIRKHNNQQKKTVATGAEIFRFHREQDVVWFLFICVPCVKGAMRVVYELRIL